MFLICVNKEKENFLKHLQRKKKKKNFRPYDGLCRILFLNDTETANIKVLHAYFDILINFIRVGKSKNMLEFFL